MIETLTLPEPARSLWLEKRDIIRNLPGEAGKRPGRAHLCGGTILAARLAHRLSTDIDLLFTDRESLIDLCQGDENDVVRDVVDVLVAAERDRAALAGAVSLLPPTSAAAIAHAWRSANRELADEFPTEIHALDPEIRLTPKGLGGDAADALLAHRYRRVEIDVDQSELAITKTIAGGPLPTERYATSDAGRALVASGISGYLNSHGPVSGGALIAQVRESHRQGRHWAFDTGSSKGAGASP